VISENSRIDQQNHIEHNTEKSPADDTDKWVVPRTQSSTTLLWVTLATVHAMALPSGAKPEAQGQTTSTKRPSRLPQLGTGNGIL
jgi:hypothetical protein